MGLELVVLSPDPLMRRNGLVNQVEFLGLAHIHTITIFALGVPRLVNILELNMNSSLQANFLSTGSAKQ